jgi:hypothetical protein
MPTVTGIATSFIDFTRASNATVTDSDGKVKWAPHNLLTNSESFDAAAWTKTNLAVSANSVAAPNGTTTADLFTPNTTSGSHRVVGQTLPVATSLTFSCFVRANGYTKFGIRESDASGAGAAFNLSGSGSVIGVYDTAGGTVTETSITPLASNWFLISCKISFASNTQMSCGLYVLSPSYTSGDLQVSWTPNGTDGVYVWGAAAYRSDLAMQPNTSAYPMYNPTTVKNLLGYTEDFSNAAWTKNNLAATPVIANAILAPNGLQTADKIVENTANNGHYVAQGLSTVANTPYVFSAYVKAAERGFAMIQSVFTTNNAYGTVNLSTGATNLLGGTGTLSAVDFGNGWWRVSLTASPSATASASFNLWAALDATTFSYTGDGTSGIYLWGAQLSDSASLDSYVPVYGAAVTSAAYYGPRRDFDPVTLACKGLLVEEQRTNLLTYSSEFDNGYWSKTNFNTTGTPAWVNVGVAPDGTTTAEKLIPNTTSGFHFAVAGAVTGTGSHTMSVFAKAGEYTRLALREMDVVGIGALFDLTAGTVLFTSAGVTSTITPVGNNWYRCTASFTWGTSYKMGVVVATNTTTADLLPSFAGNGTDGLFVYGAQVEAGSFATSYIPVGSTSAGATRNADVASVSTQAFPYSATEGTMVINGAVLATVAGVSRGAFTLVSADGSIRIGNNVSGAGGTSADFYTLPGGTFLVASGAVTAGTPFKAAAVYKASDFALSANGAAAVTSSSGTLPTAATDAQIGRIGSSSYFNGHIRQITYLPRRISNADLVTRSA